jgi:hypothetical protein
MPVTSKVETSRLTDCLHLNIYEILLLSVSDFTVVYSNLDYLLGIYRHLQQPAVSVIGGGNIYKLFENGFSLQEKN